MNENRNLGLWALTNNLKLKKESLDLVIDLL